MEEALPMKKILYLLIFILSIFLLDGCKEQGLNIVIPKASSGELNVRNSQYTRTIGKHSFGESDYSTSSPTTQVQQFYVAVDKKDLPSITNERRVALVIGNANYSHGGTLANPLNDARDMASMLKSLGFKVMKYEDLGLNEMRRAVDDFGNMLSKYDVSLFFYAGHGVQVNGNNYLIPVDAKITSKNDVEYNCIEAGRVLSKMEDAKCKTNLIILDACRNNPFERSWSRGVRLNGGGGLAFMNAPSGSLIAYSTAPGSTAGDGASGSNGLYTASLLEHMKTPNITIEEMFKRVRVSVEQKSNRRQIPWESTSLKGHFFFKIEK
jgi:uncharacterized caspase-like protein